MRERGEKHSCTCTVYHVALKLEGPYCIVFLPFCLFHFLVYVAFYHTPTKQQYKPGQTFYLHEGQPKDEWYWQGLAQ